MPSRPNLLTREINLSPLVDLVLVVLILLVVVVPMLRREPLPPPSQSAAPALHGRLDQIAVAIALDGAVFIEQRRVGRDELAELLVALHDAGPNRPVLVKGDRRLRYRQVCQLMEEINRAGFQRVSLIMEPRPAA
jgi:biopolymer transport protein TolR